jgi:hypothetical protein
MAIAAGAFRLSLPWWLDLLVVQDDPTADYLVIEGWLPDSALPHVIALATNASYRAVITTGGPLEQGGCLVGHRTYADLMRATLLATGVPSNRVLGVPAPPTRRDRTFQSALALRHYFVQTGVTTARIALVTTDIHSRRSRHLFQRALGAGICVRCVPVASVNFSRADWWRSSEGYRSVIGEWLAWWSTWLFPPSKSAAISPPNEASHEPELGTVPAAPDL